MWPAIKSSRLYISHCKTGDVPRKRQRKAPPGDFPCERIMERRNKESPLYGPFAIRCRDGVSDLSSSVRMHYADVRLRWALKTCVCAWWRLPSVHSHLSGNVDGVLYITGRILGHVYLTVKTVGVCSDNIPEPKRWLHISVDMSDNKDIRCTIYKIRCVSS